MIEGTVRSRYEKLTEIRNPFMRRAEQNALFTIPALFPPDGHNGTTPLYRPHQSLGAYGTNNLASKLMLGLFPPNRPFYRLLPEAAAEEAADDEAKKEIDKALGKAERRILERMNLMRFRPVMYRAFRNLIVGGNFLLVTRNKRMVGFSLDQYVTIRSYNGDLQEVITRELLPKDQAPQRPAIMDGPVPHEGDDRSMHRGMDEDAEVYIYTRYWRDGRIWRSYQEVHDQRVVGSEASYGRDKHPPVLALRWHAVDGEDYGRAFCDDYVGDLASLEGLSRALLRFAGAASKLVGIVRPGSTTDPRDLNKANSGDFVYGNPDDIAFLSMESKAFDFQFTLSMLQEVTERLRFAFLLNTAIQRNAERVTAEEIRTLVNEFETAHGGTLAFFADELQLPVTQMVMEDMKKDKTLPELKKIQVAIVTGVDALSRNQELQDLGEAFQMAQALFGPEALVRAVDITEALRRVLVSKSVKLDGLLKTAEEIEQQDQQAQVAAMAQQAVGPAAQAIARGATQSA